MKILRLERSLASRLLPLEFACLDYFNYRPKTPFFNYLKEIDIKVNTASNQIFIAFE